MGELASAKVPSVPHVMRCRILVLRRNFARLGIASRTATGFEASIALPELTEIPPIQPTASNQNTASKCSGLAFMRRVPTNSGSPLF